jgi:hypothetical protein
MHLLLKLQSATATTDVLASRKINNAFICFCRLSWARVGRCSIETQRCFWHSALLSHCGPGVPNTTPSKTGFSCCTTNCLKDVPTSSQLYWSFVGLLSSWNNWKKFAVAKVSNTPNHQRGKCFVCPSCLFCQIYTISVIRWTHSIAMIDNTLPWCASCNRAPYLHRFR